MILPIGRTKSSLILGTSDSQGRERGRVDVPQSFLFAELKSQNHEVLDPGPSGMQADLPVFGVSKQQTNCGSPLGSTARSEPLTLETAHLGRPNFPGHKTPVLPFPQRHLYFSITFI